MAIYTDDANNLYVTEGTLNVAERVKTNSLEVQTTYLTFHYASGGDYVVKAGPGILGNILVEGGPAAAIQIYDDNGPTILTTSILKHDFDANNRIQSLASPEVFERGILLRTADATKVTLYVK